MNKRTQLIIVSDLHTDLETVDDILRKFEALSKIVGIDEMPIDNVIIACAGDIVYSGQEQEYKEVEVILDDFFSEVRKQHPQIPISFVFAPGNHDSDLGSNKSIFQKILEDTNKLEQDTIKECINREKRFFDFDSQKGNCNEHGNKINWIRKIKCTECNDIIFNVINTPAFTYLDQAKGTMYIDTSKLQAVSSRKTDPVITIMHHPLSWFKDSIRMELIHYIRENASILITGHEHTGDEFTEEHDNKHIIHIESAVCNEQGNTYSEINSAYIEWLKDGQPCIRQHIYRWNGEDYLKVCDISEKKIETKQCSREYEFSEEFSVWLNTLPSGLRHPKIGELSFEDVYIDRRLRCHNGRASTFEVVDSDDIIHGKNKHSILFGDSSSGKTTLAINYVKKLFLEGYVPLYFDSYDDYSNLTLVELLDNKLASSYQKHKYSQYLKLERERRAIIIDNFERLKIEGYTKTEILAQLCKEFETVIVLADEAGFLEVCADAEANALIDDMYLKYRLLEMSPKAIDRMVQKWNMLSNNFDLSSQEVEMLTLKIEDKLRRLTGENIVPRYPVYILLFLCAMSNERESVHSTQIGSYGSLYEIIIRERLLNVASPKFDLQTLSSVLEYIAYRLFDAQVREIDEDVYSRIIQDFNESHGTSLSSAKIMKLFTDSHVMIDKSKGANKREYCFVHDYYYYYYVAKYLSGNISYPNVKEIVQNLCKNFYDNKNVNIWLFLTHLSRDPFLIDTIVDCANSQLAECSEIMFDNDISFIEQLKRDRRKRLTFVDRGYSREKQKRLELEESAYERKQFEQRGIDKESESEVVQRLTIAFKTIDVLGQFLRNFTGPLLVEEKQRLLIASYNLSLRSIEYVISIFRDEADEFIRYVASRAKFKNQMDDEKAIREFSVIFHDVLMWFSYFVLNKTATAVSHEQLLSPYERVRGTLLANVHPGHNMNSIELLHLLVMMYSKSDIVSLFTTDAWEAVSSKPFCEGIFKHAALNYCYTHPVERIDKERVCHYLKVQYKAVLMRRIQ